MVAIRQKFISYSSSSLNPSCLVGPCSPRSIRSLVLSCGCKPTHGLNCCLALINMAASQAAEKGREGVGRCGGVGMQVQFLSKAIPEICMYHSSPISTGELWPVKWNESRSVMSDSLWPHGLYSPWNPPGQNTGVDNLSLLHGIFPPQWSNPGLLHCRQILYQLSHKGSPNVARFDFKRGQECDFHLKISQSLYHYGKRKSGYWSPLCPKSIWLEVFKRTKGK